MDILVLNCGSSSLSWKLFETRGEGDPVASASGRVGGIGPSAKGDRGRSLPADADSRGHRSAAGEVFRELRSRGLEPDAVGHRVVHGGTAFPAPALIGPETLERLREGLSLAPLHNPLSLAVIEAARDRYPGLPQYACFDTSFHA
ncbi:MAG TPA: acetate kinase, partial [bacterium]|nr:acetate kinase [bacterium]